MIVYMPRKVYNVFHIERRKDKAMYHNHEMVYIQDVLHYQNGATWTGSRGKLRFRCSGVKDESETLILQIETWTGQLCYELSEMEEVTTFLLTDEGIEQAEKWLKNKADSL